MENTVRTDDQGSKIVLFKTEFLNKYFVTEIYVSIEYCTASILKNEKVLLFFPLMDTSTLITTSVDFLLKCKYSTPIVYLDPVY